MHIFIDETGVFFGKGEAALSAVGALAVPNRKLPYLFRKYKKLRSGFPLVSGEVKGKKLNEAQISSVVDLLANCDVVFEITFVDTDLTDEETVINQRDGHAKYLLEAKSKFAEDVQPDIQKAYESINQLSAPLYLQAVAVFDLLHRILFHIPFYYSQRMPEELGSFTWVIDGKDPVKVTHWEAWLHWYCPGALSTMSKKRPAGRLRGADYSFYDKFSKPIEGEDDDATDLKMLLEDLKFSSEAEPGLELIDILVNATRRALVGNLKKDGWQNIRRLMIHLSKECYIKFVGLGETEVVIRPASYASVANYFKADGKQMLTKEGIAEAIAEEKRQGIS